MKAIEYMETHGHEQLLVCLEPSVGMKAFIAIHDTTLGPSCGGLRIWPHASDDDAVMDVLRLSRAMTYKSAVAGLNFGGGKALILADSRTDKSEAMLRAFGRHVDSLGGRYIATEDVGMTPRDLEYVAQESSHVVGLPESLGGSGDTSVMTGLGVYLGMKAAAKSTWGDDDLSGRTVAFQGFGNVGSHTAEHLVSEGAKIVATDLDGRARKRAAATGATVVQPDEIYDAECDIFSPCALGGVLNRDTIPRLRCRVVAGGANNQLGTDADGERLEERAITYAPDFVINAGGIINVAAEIGGAYRKDRATEMTRRIYETTIEVIRTARDERITTHAAATAIAERRIAEVQRLKNTHR